MNNHISESKSGKTSDVFDLHVHKCMTDPNNEPLFNIYVYFEVGDRTLLIPYEEHLHQKGYDSINRL